MILYRFKRVFVPVGQGAFYFESLFFQEQRDFNVIYDCGTLYPSKSKRELVEEIFRSKDVDILFISHFDYDHVSLIPALINKVNTIKLVILPFLYERDKKIIISLYRILAKELTSDYGFVADLVENPRSIFKDDSNIIEVRPWEDEREEEEEINLDNLDGVPKLKQKIHSGSKFFKENCWLYIPYNFYYSRNAEKLKQMLKGVGIDVNRLINDAVYLKSLIEDKSQRKKICEVYNKLEGNINFNSLIVYSGPFRKCRTEIFNEIFMFDAFDFCNFIAITEKVSRRSSCLYTGDADLTNSKFSLRTIFSKYWKRIGIIQVPHHGSYKSFNSKNFRKCVFATISVGKNPFGHPSAKTLQELITLNDYPVLVTEKSGFRQFGYAW